MKEVTVSTNMHCASCVTKLGKVLDGYPGVHHWQADVSSPEKTVTVHGTLAEEKVVKLIQEAGFSTNTQSAGQCALDMGGQVQSQTSFWGDLPVWKRASFNTFNCLLGCAIGDFAMIIYLQVYHPQTPMWLQMTLAIIAGLITSVAVETTIIRFREGFRWQAALRMAISMSFLSMVAMEIAMNITDFMITGGTAQLDSFGYWLAFIPAAVAGFLVPLPYNYYQLKKHNRSCH